MARIGSALSLVLLTWVNLAILLINLWLSATHESVVMDTARSVAEQPRLLLVANAEDGQAMGRSSAEQGDSHATGHAAMLDDADFERLVEAVVVEDRVRSRASALRQAMHRLEQRKELSPLDDAARSRIVALGRRVAADRARLERRLLVETSSVASWDQELDTHDDRTRQEARRELQGIVSSTETEHLLRFIVPSRQSIAAPR